MNLTRVRHWLLEHMISRIIAILLEEALHDKATPSVQAHPDWAVALHLDIFRPELI